MEYTPERFAELFPAVAHTAFFDNAGGTQTPTPVAQAIADALTGGLSQRGTSYQEARNSDDIVLAARAAMGVFLNTSADGVVFGRSATSLIFEFSRTLTAGLGPGDEIVVSRLDHDANVRPWVLAAEAVGASVRWVEFDPDTGDLTADDVARALSENTRIVALTAASNFFGTTPDIPAIANLVHARGAILFLDAVAYAPHELIDLPALGADYIVCSPYKFFGPHLGVLAADPHRLADLKPAKLLPSPDEVPERFELGTLPYELLAGVSATIDLLASFSTAPTRRERLAEFYAAAGAHEDRLTQKLIAGLAQIPGLTRAGNPQAATPTIIFTLAERSPEQIAEHLGKRQIAVSAGNFYAHEAQQWAGLTDGVIRLSLAPYTTEADVDRLLAALNLLATL